MASFSGSQGLPIQLDISHLNGVLVLLRKCGFSDKRWFELGLALGLLKNTLDTVEINYPRDTSRCLLECLTKWLEKADEVNSKGGATYVSLSAAIRDMNEIAVAENIEKEKCPEVLAVHIFNKHLPLLSESLSDPVNVARLLYGERVITQEKLNDVEDDSLSLSNKRQVLLAAVKDAIQADHVALQKFSIVLGHLTSNVKLGENILTDYGIYFPSNKETLIIKVQEVLSSTESSNTVSPTPKTVEVAIHRSMSEEFTTLRSSYAKMSYNVRKAIKDANIDLEDLKDFIISMDNKLEKKLEECQDISSTLRLIDNECSLIDIELFCAVVENFQIVAADKHIKEYCDESKKYFQSSPIADYVKKKLIASATTCIFIFDWKPNEILLDDIKDILSKISGKIVRIAYIETDANDEKIDKLDAVSKWLQEGTVNLAVKRVQMLGPPGSGKTCSLHLLLNEDPPKEDNSTPIACRAVKATRISVVDGYMEIVDAKALLSRLACNLKESPSKQRKTSTEDRDTKSKEESSETISTDSPETNEIESANATESADDPDANKICQNIVEAIPTAKANLNCNWVYIIDSGGQTAFQELLPLFTRASSFNIITIDLSKGFDEKLDLQYRIDGTPFPCDPKFSYTNIEFIKDVLSSGAIVQPLDIQQSKEAAKDFQYPEYFVLGTHKDKAEPPQIEKYNKELLSLKSGSEKKGYRIIPVKYNSNQIIYPVNTILESGPHRQDEAKTLCEAIYNNISGKTFPMPVRWFAFELTLLEKAEGCSFLQLDDVLLAGESLEMGEDDTKEALQYLHNVTIILYYPQALPHIVFVDPHPILDILSRLLALTYKMEWKFLQRLTKETPSPSELDNLREKGIFTEVLLKKLNDDQGFPKSDFIKLLLYLHIIVEMDEGYFIPSALPHYPTGSIPESDIVNPLLIVWRNSVKEILPVPRGIFPLTVVNLMITVNKLKFSFPPPTTIDAETNTATNQESPIYFRYRNAMSFCIDDVINDIQVGTIHFIKKHRHIEIHFTGHKDDALKYCPEIRKAVIEAINSSSVSINLKLSHELAFACCSTKDCTEKCYCIVTNEAEEIVRCTLCPRRAIIKGQEKYWIWFYVTSQSSIEIMTNITLRDVCSSLKESKFFKSKWLDLGDQLGLLPDTLDAIEANHSADVSRRLRETLVKWLAGADNASPSWASLVKALEDIEEKTVAEHIRCKWIKFT